MKQIVAFLALATFLGTGGCRRAGLPIIGEQSPVLTDHIEWQKSPAIAKFYNLELPLKDAVARAKDELSPADGWQPLNITLASASFLQIDPKSKLPVEGIVLAPGKIDANDSTVNGTDSTWTNVTIIQPGK